MQLPILLTLPIAVSAVLAIDSSERGSRRGHYLCKPLTTLLIIALALLLPAPVAPLYRWLIVAGLICSLAGDVFLMLPGDRFVPGLASFLVAHLCYIAAFWSLAGPPASALIAVALTLYAIVLLRLLWPHLGRLRLPVIVYALVLLWMCWQAAEPWRARDDARSLQALVGAALFVISDSALAINRFARPFRHSPVVVLGTYYAAQTLIALSIGVT
jgi:uncharacterized membrane protein YhhN